MCSNPIYYNIIKRLLNFFIYIRLLFPVEKWVLISEMQIADSQRLIDQKKTTSQASMYAQSLLKLMTNTNSISVGLLFIYISYI